ncbi:MAG: hypothetical protein R2795_06410 [Saprospiraceae bacterium]
MKNTLYSILFLLLPIGVFAQITVAGDVTLPNALPVCEVLVTLQDANGVAVGQQMTDTDGQFAFSNVPAGSGYTLHFSKEDSPLNGVSTFDMVLTARHILGISPVPQYMHWIADLNGTNTVTTLDMVFMRRLILAIDTTLSVEPWAFDEATASSPDNLIEIPSLTESINVSCIGVKRGDVNLSAQEVCQ